MEAKELRIGNIFGFGEMIHEATHWDIRNLRVQELKGKKSLTYKPVSLTEEWLLKFGFKCVHIKNIHYTVNDPNGVAELHKISIFPTVNNQWHIAFSDELNGYKDYIPTTKISHVHQLQNLYFALTGEELTIK